MLPNVRPSGRLAVPWNDLDVAGDRELLWAPSKVPFGITRLAKGALGSDPETRAREASLLTALDIVQLSISGYCSTKLLVLMSKVGAERYGMINIRVQKNEVC